jgi:hypothetical protein
MDVSSVLYISLKRQEPTRLSQSQSPCPLCADINIKRLHHPPKKTMERFVAFLRFSLAPTVFFFYFPCLFAPKETLLLPKTPRVLSCLRGSFRVVKVFHPKHFLSISWISYSPVDAPRAHDVSPPFQGRAQLDAADIRRSSPKTAPRQPPQGHNSKYFSP